MYTLQAQELQPYLMQLNIGKTQLMTLGGHSFKSKWQQVDVQLQGTTIPETESVRYLGLTIDQDLSWRTHVSNVRKKAFAAIGCIRRASCYLPVKIRKMLYNSLVLPHLDYCSTVWHSCNQTLFHSLERSQNYAMRVILRSATSELRLNCISHPYSYSYSCPFKCFCMS